MSEIVYSSQRQGFQKGRIYQNPRFFDGTVNKDATSVIVVGNWPAVVAAYEAVDIPVTYAKPGEQLPENMPAKATRSKVETAADDGSGPGPNNDQPLAPVVDIPPHDELTDMSYKDLRQLVNQIDATADITSKRNAIEFLEARRPVPPAADA